MYRSYRLSLNDIIGGSAQHLPMVDQCCRAEVYSFQ